MNLAEFRASGRDVIDLGTELPGLDLEGQSGRVYCYPGGAYIELQVDGSWYLILGRSEYVAPLERLEELLFEWCKAEGFFEPRREQPALMRARLSEEGFPEATIEQVIADAEDEPGGPCRQHTDTGRGVCADCGAAIPGSPYA